MVQPPRGACRPARTRAPARGRDPQLAAQLAGSLLRDLRAEVSAQRAGDRVSAGPASTSRSDTCGSGTAASTSGPPGRSASASYARRRGCSVGPRASSTRSSSAIGTPRPRRCARAARGKPVVFNPLVSLAGTLVEDRRRFRPDSLRPERSPQSIDGSSSRGGPRPWPTPRRSATTSPGARAAAQERRRLLRRRRGARVSARLAATDPFVALFVREADPAPRHRDRPRGGAPRPGLLPRPRRRPAGRARGSPG